MYIVVIEGREEEGAYAGVDDFGDHILYIFEEEDDALRFSMLLGEDSFPKMTVMMVEEDVILKACELHDYKYRIFTSEDIVIPPTVKNSNFI